MLVVAVGAAGNSSTGLIHAASSTAGSSPPLVRAMSPCSVAHPPASMRVPSAVVTQPLLTITNAGIPAFMLNVSDGANQSRMMSMS